MTSKRKLWKKIDTQAAELLEQGDELQTLELKYRDQKIESLEEARVASFWRGAAVITIPLLIIAIIVIFICALGWSNAQAKSAVYEDQSYNPQYYGYQMDCLPPVQTSDGVFANGTC